MDLFDRIHKPGSNDLYSAVSRPALGDRLYRCVRDGSPIHMVLPAFPYKSPNTIDKVLGDLPDKADVVAVKNLDRFCNDVAKVYDGGARLTIVSDGRVYSDIAGVPDLTVCAYGKTLKDMAPTKHIAWAGLDDFFPGRSFDGMRTSLVDRFGKPASAIRDAILNDANKAHLYACFARFRMDDRMWPSDRSNKSIRKDCKAKALDMMRRNDAYSNLIRDLFPDHIRLSVHNHPGSVDKFGIDLIPGGNWGTPWHNVLVDFADGRHALMKKKDAVRAGYTLMYADGRPSHFVAP